MGAGIGPSDVLRHDGRGLMLDHMKASAEVFEFFSQFLQTAFQHMSFVDREGLLDGVSNGSIITERRNICPIFGLAGETLTSD